ncbi:hypothetical protein SAMN03159343_0879 [Klenkia marina]|uniref:Haloacid dehalogenase superfamily, subfamily IA, variant 1 with third motif having Dx(3-4)D or Dx(3-4)E n=1 Tax=Klenkia marina TaxID=1960309 RepID=A0A1G4XFS1_9ACTN|nr:hypothetical protein [Klenkia marina]SCX40092.1 hypothetical protein SAMN03159343_0879 [Klenkia marina]
MAVATFDVFETVLVRALGAPEHVDEATGRLLRDRGVLAVSPMVYAAARRAAQHDSTTDVAVHVRLPDLAAATAARLGVPEIAADLVAAELDVERAACRAVPGAVARVAAARARTGRGVVYVSDSPLPAPFLQELLEREGLFAPDDEVLASADVGSSKQHGGLFDVVAERLGAPVGELWHTGDDRWADGAHALERGWQVTLDRSAHLAGRERLLAAGAQATEGVSGRLASAARAARLQGREEGLDPGVVSVAGTVALPLFVGFARWVLREAELRGLDRLYFVARDGEVLLDVARRVAAARGADGPELRYLHGSRRSWRLAAAGREGHDVVGDLWIPDDFRAEELTPRELLHLVDLTPDEVAAIAPARWLTAPAVDQPVGAAGWADLQAHLQRGPVGAEATRRAEERAELLLAYLDQEGVTGPGRVGVVDVGWTGRATRSLEDLLAASGREAPAAYLFVGLLGPAERRLGPELFGRSAAWLVDAARGLPARSEPGEDPVMLVESLAMGRQGTTTAFAREGDRVAPVLAAPTNPVASGWSFQDYRRALELAVEAFVDSGPAGPEVDLRPTVWAQLLDLWRRPTVAEAESWGAQPYGEDFANQRWFPLARPITARRLLRAAGFGPPEWRLPLYWRNGSVRLSSAPVRAAVRLRDAVDPERLARVPRRLQREWLLRRRPRPAPDRP